uniref:Uncharacterized protein LOC110213290 n=1 Tax=Phascolarctos cinereus TaxID=38626 RepID=A0A6P5KVI7_PHACI|nr:uncharacterized protein LOC110213290 [Phascolarctos cinereus]
MSCREEPLEAGTSIRSIGTIAKAQAGEDEDLTDLGLHCGGRSEGQGWKSDKSEERRGAQEQPLISCTANQGGVRTCGQPRKPLTPLSPPPPPPPPPPRPLQNNPFSFPRLGNQPAELQTHVLRQSRGKSKTSKEGGRTSNPNRQRTSGSFLKRNRRANEVDSRSLLPLRPLGDFTSQSSVRLKCSEQIMESWSIPSSFWDLSKKAGKGKDSVENDFLPLENFLSFPMFIKNSPGTFYCLEEGHQLEDSCKSSALINGSVMFHLRNSSMVTD